MNLIQYLRLKRKAKGRGIILPPANGNHATKCFCWLYLPGCCRCKCKECVNGKHNLKTSRNEWNKKKDYQVVINEKNDYSSGYETSGYSKKWNWKGGYLKNLRNHSKNYWAKDMKIVFLPLAYAKMSAYCQKSPGEITGFGKVKTDLEKGLFIIEDVKIMKQVITAGSATINEDVMAKFIFELVNAGESPEHWKLWWHTHYNFGTFWSGTDEETISTLIKQYKGWFLSTCFNQSYSLIGRIDEIDGKVTESANLPANMYIEGFDKEKQTCEKEVDNLCSQFKFKYKKFKGYQKKWNKKHFNNGDYYGDY